MAYSFPPRGFTVNQNDLSAAEKGEKPVHSVQEESQYPNSNDYSNESIADNRYIGHPPPGNYGFSRPPQPHPFPGHFDGNWWRPRPIYSSPPFPRQTFGHNNWPRQFRPNGPPCPPTFQIHQINNNGHPVGFQKSQPGGGGKRPQNIQNGQSSGKKKSKKNPQKQTHGSDSKQEFEFFCDMCDRGFRTNDTFQEHLRSHVKCEYPGCKFEGAFKIVRQHKGMQHAPNSRPIGSLETTEEIERWKEERRKRYPTVSNIENKEAALKERLKTGNVLKTKEFGKMKHKPEIRESDQPKLNHKAKEPERILGSLGSLMSAYGSDSEKSSQEEGEIREDSPPLVAKTSGAPGIKIIDWQERRKRRKERRKEMQVKRSQMKIDSSKRKNLLEMLLAGDIRHERNVLLQCVRYIVSRGYFDPPAGSVDGAGGKRSQSNADIKDNYSGNLDSTTAARDINGVANDNYADANDNNVVATDNNAVANKRKSIVTFKNAVDNAFTVDNADVRCFSDNDGKAVNCNNVGGNGDNPVASDGNPVEQ